MFTSLWWPHSLEGTVRKYKIVIALMNERDAQTLSAKSFFPLSASLFEILTFKNLTRGGNFVFSKSKKLQGTAMEVLTTKKFFSGFGQQYNLW